MVIWEFKIKSDNPLSKLLLNMIEARPLWKISRCLNTEYTLLYSKDSVSGLRKLLISK